MEERLLRRTTVERRVGLARSTIYSRMKRGRFPQSISDGPGSVRWRESDINAYINDPIGWAMQLHRRAEEAGSRTEPRKED